MKTAFAIAAAMSVAPVLAVSAAALDAEFEKPATEPATAENAEKASENARKEPEAEEDKRICRRVRADASSRRKTKVCLTTDEWRKYNNIK